MRCSIVGRRAPASPRPTAASFAHHKAMGYVNEAFNSETLAKLPGLAGCRARPLFDRRRKPCWPTRIRLSSTACTDSSRSATTGTWSTPASFVTRSCAAAPSSRPTATPRSIVHLFARSRAEGVEAAVVEAISQVRGAFSFVMMTKDRIIGVARSARFPSACPRQAGRRVCDLLRNVRARPDWRDLRQRRRAWRSRDPQQCGGSNR